MGETVVNSATVPKMERSTSDSGLLTLYRLKTVPGRQAVVQLEHPSAIQGREMMPQSTR